MTRRLLIALLFTAGLGLVGGPRTAAAATVDELGERVTALAKQLAVKRAVKAELRETHGTRTAEVSALKRRRSSWRRDRALRKALASSQATAKKLAAIDDDIREIRVELRQARRALLRGIEAELAAKPTVARRAQLLEQRKRVALALKPPAKKIVLPSERIDPLADADELSEQATLLADTAKQLVREERRLEQREERYTKMARLQRASARADEAELFDDNRPRRTTSRQAGPNNSSRGSDGADFGAGAGAPEADLDDAGTSGASEPGEVDPGFDSDPAVVLVDVVDGGTIDALRQAERSDDPSVKAKAALRAREQVRERRERLERQRKKIEARIRAMRNAK